MHHYEQLPRDSAELDTLDVQEPPHRPKVIRQVSNSLRLWRFRRPRLLRYGKLLIRIALAAVAVLLALIVLTPILLPSYSRRPEHYNGTNPHNETVFIAANIVDEDLIRGSWGQSILELIDIVGKENVFLSIYENDSGPGTRAALKDFANKVPCEHLRTTLLLILIEVRQQLHCLRTHRPRYLSRRPNTS